MSASTRVVFVIALAAVAAPASSSAATSAVQVELDRIVSRVNGRVITQSDVRQARALKLVDDVSSDEAVQRAVENRFLILGEMNRAAPIAPPSDAEIAAHRTSWAGAIGPDTAGQMTRNGMSENDLQAWLRDDLRIGAYLKRQFGMLPEGDRTRATDDWLNRLRVRADLK
ncbi:MAG: hypothetical protein ABI634_04425 [Acidobacteriota bacterium]